MIKRLRKKLEAVRQAIENGIDVEKNRKREQYLVKRLQKRDKEFFQQSQIERRRSEYVRRWLMRIKP